MLRHVRRLAASPIRIAAVVLILSGASSVGLSVDASQAAARRPRLGNTHAARSPSSRSRRRSSRQSLCAGRASKKPKTCERAHREKKTTRAVPAAPSRGASTSKGPTAPANENVTSGPNATPETSTEQPNAVNSEPNSPLEPTGPLEPSGPSESSEPSESIAPTEPPPTSDGEPFRFFSPTSVWNEPLSNQTEIDPSSKAVVNQFASEVAGAEASGEGPWINTTNWSIPVYTVPANQPTVSVQLTNHAPEATLSSAWSAVPLPANAIPAVGTDGTLIVWQPSSDKLWEFHRLVHEDDGNWSATWGGAMMNVSANRGAYGPEAWPGARSWWGISASSLSLVGGLISFEDFAKGQINHALEMAIPNIRGEVYASPAERSDGKSANPLALPEGARLRLNPALNLASLHLPRVTMMLAEAAQRYGIVVTDFARVPEIFAQDPIPTGTNPYAGPHGYFEGKYPDQLLASFPWGQLELVKMALHGTS